jgi:hypothetical protein
MPRQDWSHPLTRPLTIPGVMKLRTLADVRTLIGHLPKAARAQDRWQYIQRELQQAAVTGDAKQVSIALQMAMMLDRIEYE